MTEDPSAPDSVLSPAQTAPPDSGILRKIFIGPNGMRAGWRFVVYVVFFALLLYIFQRALRLIPLFVQITRKVQREGVLTPQFEFIFESTTIAAALLAAVAMSRIEKRPFEAYGLPPRFAFAKRFWQGALWGLGCETLIVILISALGGFSFGSLALSGGTLIGYAILWAVAFVLVGIAEEFLFRGYTQYTLASGIGFWPAAILLSALFGAIHLGNRGEGWVGALSVFVFGIFACFTLRRTGSLWFAVGFHAASDYAETFIYSTPDSGLLAQGHLLNSSFHGQRWLTGGSIGPEGSAMDFVVFILVFIAFAQAFPQQKNPASTNGSQRG
ncbi:MAG: CPBP family intramembrane glutamic endopeptidase [Candidatus Acidiferrales bacterium]